MFSPSVRGNLLDLAHIWADADSPDSPFAPVPPHLEVVWQAGLPYWRGLSEADMVAMNRLNTGLLPLFERQGLLLRWLPFQTYPDFYPALVGEQSDLSVELFPAYTLVAIPARFRMPSPRYNHTHSKEELNNHPPIRVRWPEPGFAGLQKFLVEAMLLEGIAAWSWPTPRGVLTKVPTINLEGTSYLPAFAVATAPWFAASAKALTLEEAANLDNQKLLYVQSPEIKHIGTSIAKLDVYLFSRA